MTVLSTRSWAAVATFGRWMQIQATRRLYRTIRSQHFDGDEW